MLLFALATPPLWGGVVWLILEQPPYQLSSAGGRDAKCLAPMVLSTLVRLAPARLHRKTDNSCHRTDTWCQGWPGAIFNTQSPSLGDSNRTSYSSAASGSGSSCRATT